MSVRDEKRQTIVFDGLIVGWLIVDGLIVDGLTFDRLDTNWDLADIRSSRDAARSRWDRLALLCVVKICRQFTHVPTVSTRGPQQVKPSGPEELFQ